MYVYMNDQLLNKNEVKISPFDHGYLYGIGLFETFRVYNGHCFLLDDHLERLNNGLRCVNIELKLERREVEAKVMALLDKNGYKDAYIRLNVSAGPGEIGLQTEPYQNPNLIIFSKPLAPSGGLVEKDAVLLSIPRNTPEGPTRLKSHHYLNNLLAKREIGDDPIKEGIFLTAQGYLAEGIVSNIFWYKNDELFTPSLETGILNGVTRQLVLELASEMGISINQGFFLPKDAEGADEVFFTNSIQEIVAITSFNGQKMPGSTGEFVKRIHGRYMALTPFLYSRYHF